MVKNTLKLMGVMNVTPNSFSDGGRYLTPLAQKELWEKLCSTVQMIDIGAESTAPMNQPISFEEEKGRLAAAFDHLALMPMWPRFLSIDTYRPEIMAWAFHFLKDLPVVKKGETTIVWNDISGQIDRSLLDFFKQYPQIGLIFCHNNSPTRSVGARHMQFATEGEITGPITTFFKEALGRLKELQLPFLALDPCFGFSKSKAQNDQLLAFLPSLFNQFQDVEWVIGLSRKSFLRNEAPQGHDPYVYASFKEAFVASELFRNGHFPWFRVHSPEGVTSAYYSSSISR